MRHDYIGAVHDDPLTPSSLTDAFGQDGAHIPTSSSVHDALPETLLRRVKQFSGRLATGAVTSMSKQLPYFADLDASQRAGVQLVVQTAVVNFVEWIEDPEGNVKFSVQAFQVVPQDLASRISLLQSVEMVRVAMEFFEKWLPLLARNDTQLRALTEAVLRYGREIAFAAAAIYASAAESRGAWDSRLEALVVDGVVRGDTGPQLMSRAAALSWDSDAPATVIIGSPPPEQNVSVPLAIHNTAKRFDRAALSVVQGRRLVTIVSGSIKPTDQFLTALLTHFSDAPVVIGPTMPNLVSAPASATEAIAGIEAVVGWPGAPRPTYSSELLAERALNGDRSAIHTMTDTLVTPLQDASGALSETLDAFLDAGCSIEQCARSLYVHPNTVRYRLKKIADATGRDPSNPRDAYVLRVAATVGRLMKFGHESSPLVP